MCRETGGFSGPAGRVCKKDTREGPQGTEGISESGTLVSVRRAVAGPSPLVLTHKRRKRRHVRDQIMDKRKERGKEGKKSWMGDEEKTGGTALKMDAKYSGLYSHGRV